MEKGATKKETGGSSEKGFASKRRLLGTGVAMGVLAMRRVGVADAEASLFGPSTGEYLQSGMTKFRQGDVEGSVLDFDTVLQIAPSQKPYLWQRGLSLYYANRFQEGALQFRDDVAVNPNDTEEAIWAFLCEAQLEGATSAQAKMLRVGRDSRPVMRAAYEAFRGSGTIQQLEEAGNANASDRFYSLLYVGLWHEAQGDDEEAKRAIVESARTPYAQKSGDYMASLALVHCKERGWLNPIVG
eukprot:CAMPEP_0198215638 /NCGR_PEP_ID=MMETSP1445-20131203/51548_1 /TAXON_ID=36898 /ORGANISM="Pyramimonas sp., Strain CCMP2087" /LENGTH=241 /DNA_ID=CAMNT_0043891461 /DNA_START=290 /DNA_END=1015 /DNA_ORIENTATION=+